MSCAQKLSGLESKLTERDGYFIKLQPQGDRDAMVAVERGEGIVEAQLEGHQDAMEVHILRERVKVRGSVPNLRGRPN